MSKHTSTHDMHDLPPCSSCNFIGHYNAVVCYYNLSNRNIITPVFNIPYMFHSQYFFKNGKCPLYLPP